MSHMKHILDEDQARIDQIVRWWHAHENAPMPAYLIKAIVEDSRFFEKVAELWESETPSPVPASRHVALQEERRKRKKKIDWSMSHDDAVVILTSFTVITVLSVGMAIWLAVTI